MKLTKPALGLGSKPIALVALILSCLVVFAGFSWQQQVIGNTSQSQQASLQQQTGMLIYRALSSRIEMLNKQMETIATLPQLAKALTTGDSDQVDTQLRILTQLIPETKKACLISADVDEPGAHPCLPITFATLNSLRQAKKDGQAMMAVVKMETDEANLLLAHRITDATDNVVGVLVVTLSQEAVTDLVFKEYGANGYVELQQGAKKATMLISQGNVKWKQGAASFKQGLANSHWHIAYWPAKTSNVTSFMMVLGLVLGAIVLIGFLRELLQQRFLKHDANMLIQELADVRNSTLQSNYPLVYSIFQDVVDGVQALSLEIESTAKQASTSPKIPEKIEQYNENNLPEVTISEEPVAQKFVTDEPLDIDMTSEKAATPEVSEEPLEFKTTHEESTTLEEPEAPIDLNVTLEDASELDSLEDALGLEIKLEEPTASEAYEEPLELNITLEDTSELDSPEEDLGLEITFEEPTVSEVAEEPLEIDITFEEPATLNVNEEPLELNISLEEPVEREVSDASNESESFSGLTFSLDDPIELDTTTSEPEVAIDSTIFKAYDIRGIVGQTLNEQTVRMIGQAIGSEALDQGQNRLAVGRDGRDSSPSLTSALIDGILASGCDVVDIGMVPTPLLYFACYQLGTQSGVIVTGSHNPAEYNGLKIVLADKSLAGDDIQALYQRIEQGNILTGQGHKNETDVIDSYIERVTSDITLSRSMTVVVDCGNGVAGLVVPRLLTAIGCNVIELYCDVDGAFPNHHPDPGQPENLQDLVTAVKQSEADLGLAFDGDGDRIGVVDVNGQPIWPDRLMILFAADVLSRRPGATVIYDVKSTNLLADEITKAGGNALMWQSGHSVIKNKMQETGAQLAGEMSGHIFFKERWYGFDDALYASCRLLELLANDSSERTPTEIFAATPDRVNTPEIVIAMPTAGEGKRFMQQLAVEAQFEDAQLTTIDGLRADYPNGWGLVRASNTVSGLTLRFEANTVEDLRYIQQQFKQQMLQVKPTLELDF